MLTFIERISAKAGNKHASAQAGWTQDGKSFLIRDKEYLTTALLPHFFPTTCAFQSFTRKLYRWGFRKINPPSVPGLENERKVKGKASILVFANKWFQRGDIESLSRMRSFTAAKERSKQQALAVAREADEFLRKKQEEKALQKAKAATCESLLSQKEASTI